MQKELKGDQVSQQPPSIVSKLLAGNVDVHYSFKMPSHMDFIQYDVSLGFSEDTYFTMLAGFLSSQPVATLC